MTAFPLWCGATPSSLAADIMAQVPRVRSSQLRIPLVGLQIREDTYGKAASTIALQTAVNVRATVWCHRWDTALLPATSYVYVWSMDTFHPPYQRHHDLAA